QGSRIGDDRAAAVGVDTSAGITGMVVADRGGVEGEGPGGVRECILHRHAAAVGRRPVVGNDHVGEGQIGVPLVADAAAAGGSSVRVCGVKRNAVSNGKALHRHHHFRGGIVGVARVDVKYAVDAVAVHTNRAAAGVEDGEIADSVRNNVEVARGIIVLAG